MMASEQMAIIEAYRTFLHEKTFPCTGAKAALSQGHIACMVATHMACPADDQAILRFLYDFVEGYRQSAGAFHSAAILFRMPDVQTEEMFDTLMWQRLQALSDLDAGNYGYDRRVDADPSSPHFSFSLKEEAFFIIGLHPASSRPARRFRYPVLAFNPHKQFEQLRENGQYERMRGVIRRRDIAYSGSVNPMLNDFGQSSEARQYSGRNYNGDTGDWTCPLNISHGKSNDHPLT